MTIGLRLSAALILTSLIPLVVLAENDSEGNGESAEHLQFLEDRALVVRIAAKVLADRAEPVWNMESTTFTISGRAVKVKLEGGNVFGFAHFTPYLQEDETILLLAQGEVWVSSEDSDQVRYYPAMKSITISPGETVLFFPLGLSENPMGDTYRIELEIEVTRLKDIDPIE
jgi:hypothetical protein